MHARHPNRLWLRNGFGAVEELIYLALKSRRQDPQGEKGAGGRFFRIIARRGGQRDVVLLDGRRPPETKRETLVEDVHGPKEELLTLGVTRGFILVRPDPVIAQGLAQLGRLCRQNPGQRRLCELDGVEGLSDMSVGKQARFGRVGLPLK